ncbi:6539_t:CDS:2, partial [Ambispora gerdemannii]
MGIDSVISAFNAIAVTNQSGILGANWSSVQASKQSKNNNAGDGKRPVVNQQPSQQKQNNNSSAGSGRSNNNNTNNNVGGAAGQPIYNQPPNQVQKPINSSSQPVIPQSQNTTTTAASVDVRISAWHTLAAPDAKTKDGLGTGQLHRKGKNYRPVSEAEVLRIQKKGPPPKK